MKIRFVKHQKIDQKKWDKSILGADNGKIYAESWYLDATTSHQWDALILDDYRLVMPLPFNRKLFGFKQVYQPVLSQQLGVFGKDIGVVEILAFLRAAKKRYIRFHQNFNSSNPITPEAIKRKNLVLNLQHPYSQIEANYHKGLRKNLRQATAAELSMHVSRDVKAIINFYQTWVGPKAGLSPSDYQKIYLLFEEALRREKAHAYEVINANKDVVGMGLFMQDQKCIYNVFGASSEVGRKERAMHYMLDQIIQNHAEEAMYLDFEGSEIPGFAKFFESFGAESIDYSSLLHKKL